jgi:hypothetical protein
MHEEIVIVLRESVYLSVNRFWAGNIEKERLAAIQPCLDARCILHS